MLTLPVSTVDIPSLLYLQIRDYWPSAVAVTDYGPWRYPERPRGKQYLHIYRDQDAYLSAQYLRWICPHAVYLDLNTGVLIGNHDALNFIKLQPVWL